MSKRTTSLPDLSDTANTCAYSYLRTAVASFLRRETTDYSPRSNYERLLPIHEPRPAIGTLHCRHNVTCQAPGELVPDRPRRQVQTQPNHLHPLPPATIATRCRFFAHDYCGGAGGIRKQTFATDAAQAATLSAYCRLLYTKRFRQQTGRRDF